MMRKILISSLVTLLIVTLCGIASACVEVNLPQDPVTLSVVHAGAPESYFVTTLKDVPFGYDVYNGTYVGWCGHKNQNIQSNHDYTNTHLYSSYDYNRPRHLWHENWSKINYLLNNKIENVDWWQVQYVIWVLLDFEDAGLDEYGWSMYENASLYGVEFCPDYSEILAVIAYPGEGVQLHIFELLLIEQEEEDEPPSKVENLVVVDAKDGKLDLSWDSAYDDFGVDHYEIWRDGAFLINVTGTGYLDTGLTNGQLYNYTVRAVDTAGNKGEFSDPAEGIPTKTATSKGPTSKPKPKINEPPRADADGPYSGIEKTIVIFNGSKSYDHDHYITSWLWDFGDGTTLEGEVVEHIYSVPGEYKVTLTVTDTKGAKDTDVTTAIITPPNSPPSDPEITGPEEGVETVNYDFSIVSTDEDNDDIFYIIDWGDGTKTMSDYLPSGESFKAIHKWKESGKYTIKVTADDGQAVSHNEVTITVDKPIIPVENNFLLILLALLALMLLLLFLLLAKKKKKGDEE